MIAGALILLVGIALGLAGGYFVWRRPPSAPEKDPYNCYRNEKGLLDRRLVRER